jgi:hypothetical protein
MWTVNKKFENDIKYVYAEYKKSKIVEINDNAILEVKYACLSDYFPDVLVLIIEQYINEKISFEYGVKCYCGHQYDEVVFYVDLHFLENINKYNITGLSVHTSCVDKNMRIDLFYKGYKMHDILEKLYKILRKYNCFAVIEYTNISWSCSKHMNYIYKVSTPQTDIFNLIVFFNNLVFDNTRN